jgi:hypothetical protein
MGCSKLGLTALAVFFLLAALAPAPAGAQAVAAARGGAALAAEDHALRPLAIAHFRKAYSFYCYPRTYWWFYRPYTSAPQNYARCMPYFRYLENPYYKRGAYRGRELK